MQDFTIVFVHGTGGHDADWFPNIAKELEKRKVTFRIPKLPDQKPIQAKDWLSGVHKVVKEIKNPIVFVGYSLGTRAILLYLEKHKLRATHIILVAAFSNNIMNALRGGNKYPSFFQHRVNTDLIKQFVPNITILHSKDDKIIPFSQAVELSKELNAELRTFKEKGHFYEPEYFVDVLSVLEEKLGI
ncbi:MAG: hypothetical protein A3A65_03505 [Candidatus Chisholmbacteria bacterium RIFCSPLOWO2_01_FULL_49_14]|uniref:Serine hydrolase FSH domain-containing protein n=1 Tax=Candidatus Chisholmbacteria bacterium RIFCSPLOWO2_01_FULL_49_14 TaxID=1797593 RepID=A0A1G1W0D1_9BACT|nr:MAG: hypothetical protein A3A65_03505 [Candidatus Chisholmbacteria bacterium RIFCSPLOWO2_01_FULL_49_14]